VAPLDVTTGTTHARRRAVAPFAVSDIAFAGGSRLARHAHPRSCIAVVVAGGVTKSYTRVVHDAHRATVIAMPAGAPHTDVFPPEGARLVVVESDDGPVDVDAFDDWGAVALAHRIAAELAQPDRFTDLALEGLALELTTLAHRAAARDDDECHWLDAAAELLRGRYRDPPTATELALEVGVHPAHLARRFRARFGESVGSYARNARLDWAVDRLRTDAPLARIACEAGFADQSHFTRAFARRFGVAPGRYRAALHR
jgi:AraC family transcriptional regulator